MTFSKQQLEEMAAAVPFWFHSIDLGHGVVTQGHKPPGQLAKEVEQFALPDLRGKSVLDINSWDGFFAFEAERRGAARVVALDRYMWAMDLAEHDKYWNECRRLGVAPAPYHTMPYYRPEELPGKAGFDTAHKALGSRVEVVVDDFIEMNLSGLGTFDVVFFLGTLYHMENPLLSLRRLAEVTGGTAIIETEAAAFPGREHLSLCEFFASDELNGDSSNWWAPSEKALTGMCRAAGFGGVEVITGAPAASPEPAAPGLRSAVGHALRGLSGGGGPAPEASPPDVVRYRAVVHARK